MPGGPIERLEAWLADARDRTFVLATATPEGLPSARVVLLKAVRGGELVFGTTLASRKGRELRENPRVACVFPWSENGRQLRVSGRTHIREADESDALWASRGRDGRLVDLVSREGEPLVDRSELEAAFARADETAGEEPRRPPEWAAVHVRPETIEFWTAHPRRLAERELWTIDRRGDWERTLIQP